MDLLCGLDIYLGLLDKGKNGSAVELLVGYMYRLSSFSSLLLHLSLFVRPLQGQLLCLVCRFGFETRVCFYCCVEDGGS